METPLHHALAGEADIEVVRLLVDAGADVNAKTKPGVCNYNFYGSTPTRGETPLHRAAAFASIEIVELLLQAGADRAVRDVYSPATPDGKQDCRGRSGSTCASCSPGRHLYGPSRGHTSDGDASEKVDWFA